MQKIIMTAEEIREHPEKAKWEEISALQELSEDFIREFQDKVDWKYINMYQNTNNYWQTLREKLFQAEVEVEYDE